MEGYKFAGLKDGFRKVHKVFLILFPYVVIYEVVMSIFKDFEFNIVVDVVCGRKIDSLASLLLTFINLLSNICHTVCIV